MTKAQEFGAAALQSTPALVVDFDRALVRTEIWMEAAIASVSASVRRIGRRILSLGRSGRTPAGASRPAAHGLPLNDSVLRLMAEAQSEGRHIHLLTRNDPAWARMVASDVGMADDLIVLDGHGSEATIAARLRDGFGVGAFDYVGAPDADPTIWSIARFAYVVVPRGSSPLKIEAGRKPTVLVVRAGGAASYLRALRPHQWLKNLLLLAPALAAHALGAPLVASLIGLVSFSLCASSVYLTNDLLDLGNDRAHSRKRWRPFAAGDISLAYGALTIPLLLVAAVSLGLLLPLRFLLVLGGYYCLTLAYSFGLKRKPIIDVMALASLYGARLIAGSAASGVPLSPWLEALSVFLFLSLAIIKRCTELVDRAEGGAGNPPGRGYRLTDLPILQAMASSSGYLAVLVLALYLNSTAILSLYHNPHRLWLICVVMLFWISRILLMTSRGEMHDDPVVFAVKDRVSQICGLLVLAAVVAAVL